MGEQVKEKKQLVTGILAHVDAGKTTLSEALLYVSGNIRKLGRVDKKDAFLDTYELERQRGITIFSKQARMKWGELGITLLDTPGHVDFSAEMERTLRVLDYAVLVISGADGVQGHTETLWKLLEKYEIPTFVFINKMDQPGVNREERLEELKKRLSEGCIAFDEGLFGEESLEELAVTDEHTMEAYLETGAVSEEEICRLIRERKVFPCYFGSALKLEGVEEFLAGLDRYTRMPDYPQEFGAKVFKIARDDQGNRLTYMKITGGSLQVKGLLNGADWQEKADQIRLYSGAKFETADQAEAGCVCAVTGLTKTYPGQGLGIEPDAGMPALEPVLSYQICLPEGCDVHGTLRKLRQLEEEEPELHIVWEEELNEIHAQVMGEVQMEILKTRIAERFGVEVTFDSGNIVYKETIQKTAEGVGHFEPLRHYAEVHLLLEPGEAGSGLILAADCSEDLLDLNWQRLILTHLAEKKHRGVLAGAEITDMKMTLVAGKAHLKHTEGGDFREATYRAVRQGLKQAECILLEPVYEFRLEVPLEMIGRAMADIQRMNGRFEQPEQDGEMSVLEGIAPVVDMRGYQTEVAAYTRGRGRLALSLHGYERCHNEEEILERIGYDAEQDVANPTGSVFCGHGAGYYVPWDEVEAHMHLPKVWDPKQLKSEEMAIPKPRVSSAPRGGFGAEERELEEIFTRTYGDAGKKRLFAPQNKGSAVREAAGAAPVKHSNQAAGEAARTGAPADEYLLVDGYNIIFSWDELKELAKDNLSGARGRLMDILSNYQGYRKNTLILVFDAYKVEGGQGQVLKYHNIHVVYTKEAETADQYIEKTVHAIGRKYRVTVATSDALEQVIILGQGAGRLSAQGLKEEIEAAGREMRTEYLERNSTGGRSFLFDGLSEQDAKAVQDTRLGKRELFSDELVKKSKNRE